MIFASGFQNPEGPVALPDGTWLLVEGGAERGCITWISADGTSKRTITKTGRPNGLAVDAQGAIWVTESLNPSLLRVTMDGQVEIIARECGEKPFLFPNDLCFGTDGQLYMTDSGVNITEFAPDNRVRADYQHIEYQGRVLKINPATGASTEIDRDLKFPNGIAFDVQGNLYVSETVTGNVYCYREQGSARLGPRKYFGNVNDPLGPPGWRGPDGMAFGTDGRLYVAVFGQGDVTVLDRSGALAERIVTRGVLPTNVAFARPGSQRLHVTEYEFGAFEAFNVGADGIPLGT